MTDLVIGKKLGGRYQIVSQLGKGGFGKTFLAEDCYLPGKQKCVVKQLKPQATDPFTLKTANRLFEIEAETLYQLGTHPQIPQLFAYFEEDQEFYLVQEYIKGNELTEELQCIAKDKDKEAKVISLLQEILAILSFVHQNNVIHRDINGRNLIRRQQDGKLFLIDFGAVKQITTQIVEAGQTKLTVAIGTPGYRPSEQAQGYPRLSSDIYAVGMIGIKAITGCSPDQLLTTSDGEISWHHLGKVTPSLARVLDKMVRYDFRDRYPSAVEALEAIEGLTETTTATVAVARASKAIPRQEQQKHSAAGRSRPSKDRIRRSVSLRVWLVRGLIAAGVLGFGALTAIGVNNLLGTSDAKSLYTQGNTLYGLKRYEEAQSAYEQALEIRPSYEEAWKGKGDSLQKLNHYEEAQSAYEQAIQVEPNYWQAWIGRAQVLEKLGRNQEAIEAYDSAISIKSDLPQAWIGRAELQMKLKQYSQAVDSFEQLLKLEPKEASAWHQRGWALHQLGQYQEAIKSYDKALDLEPYTAPIWYARGNALMNLNNQKQAAQAYQKAVQSDRKFYQAWYSRGNALSQLGDYEGAYTAYDGAVKADSDQAQAWYQRGWTLHQLGRYREAVKSYDRAIKLDGDNSQTWYNRGNSLYNLGDYVEAIASYDRAVALKNDYDQAWNSRGNALATLQRYEDAIASYDQALQYNPDYPEAQAGKARSLEQVAQKERLLNIERRSLEEEDKKDKKERRRRFEREEREEEDDN